MIDASAQRPKHKNKIPVADEANAPDHSKHNSKQALISRSLLSPISIFHDFCFCFRFPPFLLATGSLDSLFSSLQAIVSLLLFCKLIHRDSSMSLARAKMDKIQMNAVEGGPEATSLAGCLHLLAGLRRPPPSSLDIVFTLVLLPTSTPPLSSPPDSVLVDAVPALSIRRTNSSALRRLFSRPSLPVFRDASVLIHLLGSQTLFSLRFPSSLQRDLLPRIIQSCSARDLSAVLPLAAHAGAGNAVSVLLSGGADPNTRNAAGKPAISLAVSAGSAEAVEALLESGAVDRPFHEAAAKNRTDLIALLLAWTGSGLGFDWTAAPDPDGRTPVHYAAATGALDALRLCLSSGGDPSRPDANGWTPLHCSAAGGLLPAAEFLIFSSDFDPRRALTREKRRREGRR
ncbi:hypothetical protein KSP40_PGU016748 [Platanthera guangdongensis]|uniref:Uncharacterized protein n=1 Tax=Platanthera guangdongensis TaxID=2320717 RepID=A0ABR2MAF0_9ASPA